MTMRSMSLSIFFVFFVFAVVHEGSLVVMGVDRAIFADGGQDVTLNCSVDSHVPISEIEEVTWKKIDRDQDILVLLYQDSEIFPDSSHERYQGRVEFFSSEIPKGNFSLKLRDVKVEDKGEFMCEVHTRNMSGHTIVLLQGVGFSAHHIAVLVLCSVTLLFAIGFCGPVFIVLRKKVASKKDMKRHIFLILCPNICMFMTFCLWSTEGILSEVIACSIVSIMRPVILMKTSSYLGILPQCLKKAVKALAIPLYHSMITLAACSIFFGNLARIQIASGHIVTILAVLVVVISISAVVLAVYGLQMHLTICLEIFNLALLGILLSNSNSNFDYSFEIASVITPQIIGMMVVLSLQRHLFQGKPFGRVYIAVSSIILTLVSLCTISVYILLSITMKDFAKAWVLLFESVLYLFAWLVVIYLLCCHQTHRRGCCSQWRKIGYLCCSIIVAFLIIACGAGSFHYVNIIMEDKDHAGYLALIALVHVLAAACLFKHPKYLPGLLHTMTYMFGAVGLSTINAIALATELILKAVKGTRNIEDLRVIVLPLETVFLIAWLALQIYDAWMRLKDRIKRNFEDEKTARPETVPETEHLSNPHPDPHPDESEVISKL
ncbi:uncharacterized protein LOC132889092 isoform X2 [Neoarius graeffei]|uniref:uncharacterized protein LOC132889092 isoform X2 n=1 Tax=Neoarius graeffei TaxID=443677 RepID=UPI00298C7ED4|nr:uncharacterized protein LOC132889092 isoform X2 [Neoarius graeffei]